MNPKPETEKEAYRKYQREYKRELHAARKRFGLCLSCGKEEAFKPFNYCPACLEKMAANYIHYRRLYKENPEKRAELLEANRLYRKRRYADRKANGICPVCGKHKPLEGKTLCEICLDKKRIALLRRSNSVKPG